MLPDTMNQQLARTELWSVPDAAKFLRLSRETVRKMVRAGEISSIRPRKKIWISSEALRAYLVKRAS